MKLYIFRTVRLSIISEFIHCTLSNGICHTGFSDRLRAGPGGKKGHHQVSYLGVKSGTHKYRLRAKRKYPYWEIN